MLTSVNSRVLFACREAQIQLGVLHHLAGQHEEAWQELGVAAEQLPPELEGSDLAADLMVLLEKARLMVQAAVW